MDDNETKQLLREIRDIQKEHLELIRTNVKEATEVNRVALENHANWKQQSNWSTKWMIIFVVIIVLCAFAVELFKRLK